MLKKSKSIQSLKILFKKYYKSSQWSILEKPSVRYMIFRINRYFNQLVLLTNLFAMYLLGVTFSSVQFISVTQLFLTLCDPMDCSPPGLPVHHQCPEFTQTHVHQASGAIQPSFFFFFFYKIFFFFFFSYIEMKRPWVYMSSPSRSPLPPPSPPAPSRSSQSTRSERLSHASNLGWWSVSPLIVYMFRCYSLETSHPRLLPQSLNDCSINLCLFFCSA